MTDPGELPSTARDFLARVRLAHDVDDERVARIRERVLRATAVSAAAVAGTTLARAWWKFTGAKVGLCVALVGAGALAIQRRDPPQHPVAVAPAASVTAAVAESAKVVPSETVSPKRPGAAPSQTVAEKSVPAHPVKSAAPTPSSEPDAGIDLAGEAALLGAAQTELAKGNAARALELFDRHATLYPHGQLAHERGVGRVLASCALGQPDAKTEARAILAAGASPKLAARLRDRCGIDE